MCTENFVDPSLIASHLKHFNRRKRLELRKHRAKVASTNGGNLGQSTSWPLPDHLAVLHIQQKYY